MAKKPSDPAQTQHKRFIEAAREVGTDDDEASFEQRLKAVAGAPSSSGAKKSAKQRKK